MELEAILNHPVKRTHVVLVDDASTLKYLRNSQNEVLTPAEFQSRVAAKFPRSREWKSGTIFCASRRIIVAR